MSHKLLEILPPEVLKKLFVTHLNQDLTLTKDSVEHFCRKVTVQPGMNYVGYVQSKLPRQAIRTACWDVDKVTAAATSLPRSPEEILLLYGRQFSRFYYNRNYFIRFPDARTVVSADAAVARVARDIIGHAISVRDEHRVEDENACARISAYLRDRSKVTAAAMHYLREILGQAKGLRLSTLLTLLPRTYLDMIQTVLGFYIASTMVAERGNSHAESSPGELSKLVLQAQHTPKEV